MPRWSRRLGKPALEPIPAIVWRIAIVEVLGAFVSMLDSNIVNIGLTTLSHRLESPLSDVQWVVSGYLVALAAVTPLTGWMARRFGTKNVWLISLGAFTVFSGLCASASTIGVLVAFRILQGLAGGLIMPAGQMILADAAGPTHVGRVMSVVGVAPTLTPALGPTIGGLILDHASWQWLFLVNVPIGIVGIIGGLRVMPASHRSATERFDRPGFLLVCSGLPLVVFGLEAIANSGNPITWTGGGTTVLGFGLLGAFVRYAWNRPGAILDLRLFANRAYASALTSQFFTGAVMFGVLIMLPLYFEVARGEGTFAAGLLIAPQGVASVLVLPRVGSLTEHYGGGRIAAGGLVVAISATLALGFVGADTSYWVVSAILVVRGFGVGMSGISTVSAAFTVVKRAELSHAAPQLSMAFRVGGALGSALLIIVYEHVVAGAGAARLAHEATRGFSTTMWCAAGLTTLAFAPVTLLARAEARLRKSGAAPSGDLAPVLVD